jgi:hypothetical protein
LQKPYEGQQRRQRVRLVYPITERPTLILLLPQEEEYEVVDLSEDGVRFFYHPPHRFLPMQAYKAKVRFHDGETEEIQGNVIRLEEETIALCLFEKIPYKRIVKEELYLRKKIQSM